MVKVDYGVQKINHGGDFSTMAAPKLKQLIENPELT